jgi:phage terminase small subunit
MVRDAGADVRVLARELGLTPSSLSTVHVAPAPPDSRMLELMTPHRRTQ